MSVQKPFMFTAVSYIKNNSETGFMLCREEIIFKEKLDTGEYVPVHIKKYMQETEQMRYDKQMMKNAGTIMSK